MSLTSKHTPGPWRKEDYCQTADEVTILNADDIYVCSIDCDGVYCNENEWVNQIESDAHLIAAAPDLLAAVELALDLADNDLVDFNEYGLTCDSDISNTYRAAINKAKGGTE